MVVSLKPYGVGYCFLVGTLVKGVCVQRPGVTLI